MDPVVARKMWRTLEPVHGIVYFAPDAGARYRAIGLPEHMHYFAPRAAAMGPVPAEVVIATFFNFHPALCPQASCSRRVRGPTTTGAPEPSAFAPAAGSTTTAG